MPDANIAHEASNLLGTSVFNGTNGFYAQGSDSQSTSEEKLLRGPTANVVARNIHNKGNDFTQRYGYNGNTLRTSLGAVLTAFGSVMNGKQITGLEIDFPDGGSHTMLTVTCHNHDTNTHSSTTNPPRTFNIASLIPTAAGLGVPAIFGSTIVNSDCSPVRGTINAQIRHEDKMGASGAQFHGENISCRVDASLDFEGVPTEPNGTNVTAWEKPELLTNDDNEDTDSATVTAHQDVDHS